MKQFKAEQIQIKTASALGTVMQAEAVSFYPAFYEVSLVNPPNLSFFLLLKKTCLLSDSEDNQRDPA